ncbi:hypothetical protein [Desulfosarcina ovata]|uniref:Uncharacterized protein n=1 Tax=Desulfosarcina ovata subsp. ovata TaxID=2752305 RepID=A0A5K8A6V9_9BACT|nr:hypothetical protein [Desulfosarcina ovata]BBO88186.1 hypothetical protein DSCOOX_13660 [Desulfosarcina ovata subsp. ovata]
MSYLEQLKNQANMHRYVLPKGPKGGFDPFGSVPDRHFLEKKDVSSESDCELPNPDLPATCPFNHGGYAPAGCRFSHDLLMELIRDGGFKMSYLEQLKNQANMHRYVLPKGPKGGFDPFGSVPDRHFLEKKDVSSESDCELPNPDLPATCPFNHGGYAPAGCRFSHDLLMELIRDGGFKMSYLEQLKNQANMHRYVLPKGPKGGFDPFGSVPDRHFLEKKDVSSESDCDLPNPTMPPTCPFNTGGYSPAGCRFSHDLLMNLICTGVMPDPECGCPFRDICGERLPINRGGHR